MDTRRQSGLWNHNPDTGYYEQIQATAQPAPDPERPYQYYQHPAPRLVSNNEVKRSFSQRSGGPSATTTSEQNHGVRRSDSKKHRSIAAAQAKADNMREGIPQHVQDLLNQDTTAHHLAHTQHVNSTALPGSSQQAPLRIDPDYVPDNLRSQAWSPDAFSPRAQLPTRDAPRQRQTSNASNTSAPVRHASVSGRSPLQRLEVKTKEEKRALLEEAEQKSRQRRLSGQGEGELGRQGTLRSEKNRVVSDPARSASDRRQREERPRQVSAGAPAVRQENALDGVERFHSARDALKKETSPPKELQAAKQPQTTSAQRKPRRETEARHEPLTAMEVRQVNSGKPQQVSTSLDRTGSSKQKAYEPESVSAGVERTNSSKYRHRARDAGFAGAAAAAASANLAQDVGAERGKAAYERRKSQMAAQQSPVSPITPTAPNYDRTGLGIGRAGSKTDDTRAYGNDSTAKSKLHGDRIGATSGGGKKSRAALEQAQQPDIVSRQSVETAHNAPIKYSIPPQTAAGREAKAQVGFGEVVPGAPAAATHDKHRFGDLFHRHDHEHRGYQESSKPLDEWRRGGIARLMVEDLEFEEIASGSSRKDKDVPWWEQGRRASSSGSRPAVSSAQYDGPYEEQANGFRPRLFLKCGPLLRYTGIRKEAHSSARSGRMEKEIWRGSIMIVTEDDQSDLSSTPTLRLFAQPSDLHMPPPQHIVNSGQEMLPEYEDPVAGQVKLSRTGRALYVRPVHDIEGGIDLSREENPEGLFEATRTPVLGPQSITGPDGRQSQHITFQDKSRIKKRDGEKASRHRDVKAIRLHTERNATFWRFNIEIELGSRQHRVAYRVNKGPAIGFWIPARGETMNIMFHSCNGFSYSVDPNAFSGPDPLWRDVLNRHQARPFHVMIGGGDQVYNDAAMHQTTLFREWLETRNPVHKHRADFSPEMQDELESFYLDRYAMWFSQGLFGMANSQIPMVNIWDDHDIIDGFGSYPHDFMSTRVFTGLGAVAFKYYMLFQHQSLVAETEKEEPSWLLGKSPGPYISERSRSVYMSLGRKIAFLGLDCRTERMRDEILSQETYDLVFDRLFHEIEKNETKHLIVLLGVPIAYPRLNFLENILTSRAMDPIKALGRTGMLGGFLNKFDGGVEILDDLDDHWTAKHHKGERNWFVRELQDLASEKSVRVTILGGDVHLGAVGQFYSNKKLGLPKDRDFRYMPNVVSSAIVNTPPPPMMADVLNKRNKVHHLDAETDEDLIPMFEHDVDGSKRNNRCLLPRRNFAMIREFVPGRETPPGTPNLEAQAMDGSGERRFPPGSMKRTMSLTRGAGSLVRRLSGSGGRSKNPPMSPWTQQQQSGEMMQRANSLGSRPSLAQNSANIENDPRMSADTAPVPTRPGFHRRPTNLTIKEARKAAAKGGAEDDGGAGMVDLEHGLDISLCMEIDQRDPAGATEAYRLLVPALKYEMPVRESGVGGEGEGAGQTPGRVVGEESKRRRMSLMDRLRGFRMREEFGAGGDGPVDEYSDEEALGMTPPLQQNTMGQAAPVNEPHFSAGAYDKGYHLSGPPIGQRAQQQQPKNHPYPASGFRRASGRTSPPHSEGSLTPEHEYAMDEKNNDTAGAQQANLMPVRRGSKAERFFGIGDTGPGGLWGNDGKLSLGMDDGGNRLRKGGGWKVWKG